MYWSYRSFFDHFTFANFAAFAFFVYLIFYGAVKFWAIVNRILARTVKPSVITMAMMKILKDLCNRWLVAAEMSVDQAEKNFRKSLVSSIHLIMKWKSLKFF